MLLREAVLADAEAMSDVLVASITTLCVGDHGNRPDVVATWISNKTPQSIRAWIGGPNSRLLVAEREGVITGVAGYAGREVTLNYVSPEHRFEGVSSALLDTIESGLGRGEVRLTSTGTARRFYRARGWKDIGAVESWLGMPVYPMHKML